ncbi:hypothetical protein H4N58_13705 [Mumia sp. ZJ1417]|uniref:hypothetical protein n=1 Tax=unclassified Mumia TaxID=2621872 RepID=UPI001420FF99|nr:MULTISPECIES: hypothetical protein [unclassified Mumia]QMW65258.1 hypothetical protein H4N58_13705 [Mumia sp. ZJ1417]
MSLSRTAVLVSAGVIVGLVAGGTTVAVAASSAKTVKVCTTKKGVVRSADAKGRCPKKSKKQAINVRGPAGSRGAPGVAGARGPSDAWRIGALNRAEAVKVPAGSYVVNGTVYFGRASATAQCWVWHQDSPTGSSGIGSFLTGANAVATLAVSDAFTVTATSDVWVECSGGEGFSVTPRVTVLAVGTLHD